MIKLKKISQMFRKTNYEILSLSINKRYLLTLPSILIQDGHVFSFISNWNGSQVHPW